MLSIMSGHRVLDTGIKLGQWVLSKGTESYVRMLQGIVQSAWSVYFVLHAKVPSVMWDAGWHYSVLREVAAY